MRSWGLAEMMEAPAYGIMVDEGTDIGWEHVLIVYRKYLQQRTGKVTTKYHRLLYLEDAKACDLKDAIGEHVVDCAY